MNKELGLCRESVEFYDCTATCVLVATHVGKHHFKFDGDQALREAREEVLKCRAALGRETELRVEEQRLRVTSGRLLVTVCARAHDYIAAFDAAELPENVNTFNVERARDALRVALGYHQVGGAWTKERETS